MKNKNNSTSRSNRTAAASVLVVVLILGIFAALYFYAHDAEENTIKPTEYAEYEKGRVVEILMDNCEVSEVAEKYLDMEKTFDDLFQRFTDESHYSPVSYTHLTLPTKA